MVLNHDTVKLTELAITGSFALSVAPTIERVKVVEVSGALNSRDTDTVAPAAMVPEENAPPLADCIWLPVYTVPSAETISILVPLKVTACSPRFEITNVTLMVLPELEAVFVTDATLSVKGVAPVSFELVPAPMRPETHP